ncbi:MAG: tRNA-dihydrouridine synthase family protein [Oscillospiraceae bacterium]|nr:tRNA-dihydrouridine synthase family protein [Oscillospiraceae bacterium]
MRYYFAPLEGLTDAIYRRLHHKFFPGIDRYYTPFISPTAHRVLTPKEQRELPPADQLDYVCIPQVLTKHSEDLLWFAEQCADLGYTEINLNLGCPSGTVTAKGKGSGMLKDPDALDRFLDEVFYRCPIALSVKTRIGFAEPGEFDRLLQIFNQYPICELIIHPRVRAQFYNGPVEKTVFEKALADTTNPLCYNGNLCTKADIEAIRKSYPQVESVMLGRALIADPGLLTDGGSDAQILEAFHDALLEQYIENFGGARNAMFRMKENWHHMLCKFENADKLGKQLRKTTDIAEYRHITREIFNTLPLRKDIQPVW